MIPWERSFSVGDKTIDKQHKDLLRYLSKLFDAVQSPAGVDMGDVYLAFHTLAAYTHEHFGYEEQYMEAKHMKGVAAHKQIHDRVRKVLASFLVRFNRMRQQKSISGEDLRSLMLQLYGGLEKTYLKHMLHAKTHRPKRSANGIRR